MIVALVFTTCALATVRDERPVSGDFALEHVAGAVALSPPRRYEVNGTRLVAQFHGADEPPARVCAAVDRHAAAAGWHRADAGRLDRFVSDAFGHALDGSEPISARAYQTGEGYVVVAASALRARSARATHATSVFVGRWSSRSVDGLLHAVGTSALPVAPASARRLRTIRSEDGAVFEAWHSALDPAEAIAGLRAAYDARGGHCAAVEGGAFASDWPNGTRILASAQAESGATLLSFVLLPAAGDPR